IWSFEAMNPPRQSQPDVIEGGRWAIFNNPFRRTAFIQNFLVPLARRALQCRGGGREALYGWDLINEPEQRTYDAWQNNGIGFGVVVDGGNWRPFSRDAIQKRATLEGMRSFIREAATAIHGVDRTMRVSVGFMRQYTFPEWNDDNAPLDLDLLQFHYY